MKKLLTVAVTAAAVALVSSVASAAVFSEVTFHVTPDDPGLAPWHFVAGLDTDATDQFDLGLDAVAPPWPPGPEIRMETLGVPGAAGPLMRDYRDGAEVGPVAWTPADDDGLRNEFWGLGSPDVLGIDGSNLGLTGFETGVLTWDLSAAGDATYYLYDMDADVEFALTEGGSYQFAVMRRFGIGPALVLSADLAPIPEPGTLLLLGSGLLGLAGLARKR